MAEKPPEVRAAIIQAEATENLAASIEQVASSLSDIAHTFDRMAKSFEFLVEEIVKEAKKK